MPILNNVTVDRSEVIWQKGDRTIHSVTMNYQGSPFTAKTFSGAIAKVGWSGDVEVYKKQGQQGPDQFVKQAPKEEGSYGQGSTSQSESSSYPKKDEKAIQAMWAISQSIAAHSAATELDPASLESVQGYAVELFKMVDEVKKGSQTDEPVYEPIDGDVSLDEIDSIFGKNETKPWTPNQ